MLLARLALLVSYDGTPYRGWNDVRDVALRPALAKVLRGTLPMVEAASRTDAGVHAAGQVCSLALSDASSVDCGQLVYSLNQILPPEVAVRRAVLVGSGFDCRDNCGKFYEYRFSLGQCRNPLTRLHEWHVPLRRGQTWDATLACEYAAQLRGRHNFAAFANRPRGRERSREVNAECVLDEITLEPQPGASATTSWRVRIRGNRFLYKMVRNLVGSIVRVGTGELSSAECKEALAQGAFARSASVPLTAPAHGLVLKRVEYANELFGKE